MILKHFHFQSEITLRSFTFCPWMKFSTIQMLEGAIILSAPQYSRPYNVLCVRLKVELQVVSFWVNADKVIQALQSP